MTVQRRFALTVAAYLLLLGAALGFMVCAVNHYDEALQSRKNVSLQIRRWLTLNFEVSQYLKSGMESILSADKADEAASDTAAMHARAILLELEKAARMEPVVPVPPANAKMQNFMSARVREQFGAITQVFERARTLTGTGDKNAATLLLRAEILTPGLQRELSKLIGQAIRLEEDEYARIEVAARSTKDGLKHVEFCLLIAGIGLSIFLIRRLDASIRSAAEAARRKIIAGAGGAGGAAASDHDGELALVAASFEQLTAELKAASSLIEQQRQQILVASKMSALGEMAGGVAHEINNPLGVIHLVSAQLQSVANDQPIKVELVKEMAAQIEQTALQIARIMEGLRSFSRDGSQDPHREIKVGHLIERTLGYCQERLKEHAIELQYEPVSPSLHFEGRETEISQVLLNLLNNAHDAVENAPIKWIRLTVLEEADFIELRVTDSGAGIPEEIRARLFQPFFTTKASGVGTGLGLSFSIGLVQAHHGALTLDTGHAHTSFVVRLPKRQPRGRSATAA